MIQNWASPHLTFKCSAVNDEKTPGSFSVVASFTHLCILREYHSRIMMANDIVSRENMINLNYCIFQKRHLYHIPIF